MMPMHMDSSNLRHMRPQRYPYYQGFGNNPQHMAMDVPSPGPFGNWPAPSQCYGSCIPPAYNPYWPCYPSQLPHHPCCVNHSGFHPVHHASHAPPCYSYQPFPVGYEPRYDYEKEGPGKHFCMKCNPKADGGIVIEEQEQEKEKGKSGEAIVPVRSTDSPYPIIWIPHESAKNQGQGNGSQEEPPAEKMKIQKSEPKFWNGYFPVDESAMKSFAKNQDGQKKQSGETVEFPFDISKLKSLLQGQDGKDVQIQQNREAPAQFPYPIIWIPSHGKPEEASEGQARTDEGRSLKSFPSDNLVNNARHGGEEGNSKGKACSDEEGRRSVRNIPVKLSEDHVQKPTEPTKRIAKEIGENAKTEKSSSQPKASKLPPVCLRVDPLPSKKRTGGSKSLSPPRCKEEPLTSEARKLPSPRSFKEAETKTIPVACNLKCEEKKHLNAAGREKEVVDSYTKTQEGANSEVLKPHETKENGEKLVKVSFTEEEAARTIQSMYRAYDVRRSESLKKLKQIAKVREKMGDVKKRIHTLERSTDLNIEEKEFIAVEEMVMSLILQLDSIQGLHPSIRDFRKSLARELLDMQESIDSLKKKRALVEKEALRKQVDASVGGAGKDGISQANGNPVTSDTCQLVEAKQMLSDPSAQNCSVLLPSTGEHSMNVMNRKHEEVGAEAKEGSKLSDTLVEDLKPTTEADGSEVDVARPTVSEKVEEVETVVPVNPPSADGKGKIVTNSEKDEATEESLESPHGLAQKSETKTDGVCSLQGLQRQETETEVSEDVDKTTVSDTSLPSQNDVQHSGQSIEVIEEAQDPLHPSAQVPPCTCESIDTSLELLPQETESRAASIHVNEQEAEQMKEEEHRGGVEDSIVDDNEGTARINDLKNITENIDGACELSKAETAEPKEETSEIEVCKYELDEADAAAIDHETQGQGTNVDNSTDGSKDISQETTVLDTEVREYELSRADTRVMDRETESKETEADQSNNQSDQNNHEPKEEPEQVPGPEEVSGHETSEETKKLMEENQRFRETMEKLVSAGREQLEIISNLTGRVKSLEKKLSQRNTTKVGRHKTCRAKHTSKPKSCKQVISSGSVM